MLSTIGNGELELGQVTSPVLLTYESWPILVYWLLAINFIINQSRLSVHDVELYSESAHACVEDNYDGIGLWLWGRGFVHLNSKSRNFLYTGYSLEKKKIFVWFMKRVKLLLLVQYFIVWIALYRKLLTLIWTLGHVWSGEEELIGIASAPIIGRFTEWNMPTNKHMPQLNWTISYDIRT